MFKIGHHQKLYFLSQYLNNTPAERSWGGENNSFYFKPSIVVVALPSADQGGRRRWLENKHKNGLNIEYIVNILIINIKRFENCYILWLAILLVEGVWERKALLIITCLLNRLLASNLLEN